MVGFSTLKITLLSLAASVPLGANAADCFGSNFKFYGNLYNDAWGARGNLCKNGGSGVSCNPSNTYCSVTNGNVIASWVGSNKNDMLEKCSDALNNIINQCVYSNKPGGDFVYNYNTWTIAVLDR
ncbi:uncharacterized protein GGS25DRAFT_525452 [Hypoxylon fragiforme]|uniref:uncharacterized protein n=1 Tax=Hypoxylon fragiforme TaxID=63214 RepID=UPI0020C71056|nr:uncharacterized protein GGS25DRAFT_525452 [Hypoxylon fragiforme]KAI2604174.1 hypothetical protein GGS25DRAFT_525452 [Hypoxylon fragiforme]